MKFFILGRHAEDPAKKAAEEKPQLMFGPVQGLRARGDTLEVLIRRPAKRGTELTWTLFAVRTTIKEPHFLEKNPYDHSKKRKKRAVWKAWDPRIPDSPSVMLAEFDVVEPP